MKQKTMRDSGESRLSIRASERQKLTLKQAAAKRQMTISQFVLQASVGEAEKVLAEDHQLVLNSVDYGWLCDLLDEAPRELPTLNAALAKKPVWDVEV